MNADFTAPFLNGHTFTFEFNNLACALVAPLSKSLGIKVGYVIRYNAQPPVRNNVQLKTTDTVIREKRRALGVRPVYKRVDTCAAEFASNTAYMYSTYEAENSECEAALTDKKKIMVLGGGPNRIGQGIEFDYCCVHAALALREDGYETIMVNCNPETVSTDYDTSDRLYFEPLTLEDVLEIVDKENPPSRGSC